jgi:hypothetical protein
MPEENDSQVSFYKQPQNEICFVKLVVVDD